MRNFIRTLQQLNVVSFKIKTIYYFQNYNLKKKTKVLLNEQIVKSIFYFITFSLIFCSDSEDFSLNFDKSD